MKAEKCSCVRSLCFHIANHLPSFSNQILDRELDITNSLTIPIGAMTPTRSCKLIKQVLSCAQARSLAGLFKWEEQTRRGSSAEETTGT